MAMVAAGSGSMTATPILIGDEVPNFVAETQLGKISFHNYIEGAWCMLFSHPGDFTPVCTTEFGMLSKLKAEFDARNCKIIGLSIDSVSDHEAWLVDVIETQDTEVEFPVIADESGHVARTFGVIHPNAPGAVKGQITVRAVFLIDPQRRLQLHMCYAANTGRNFYEIIRALDALQLTAYHQVATPANWKNGEDVLILPSVPDDLATDLFPKGFTTIKSYLRITPMPMIEDDDEAAAEDLLLGKR